MKLGLCTAPENTALAAELGFDYVECGLSALAALTEEEYQSLLSQKPSFAVPITHCNGFLPGTVKTTGPDVSQAQQREYLQTAFSRASALGVGTVVYGSGASRGVPEGWSHVEAWKQIIDFLKLAAEYAEKYGITIAIEPLRRKECNIVNLVSEATLLAAAVHHPRVGALGDTFHMRSSYEPYQALTYAGEALRHVHISHTLPDMSRRIFPAEGDGEDYQAIFAALLEGGYDARVSVEGGCDNFAEDAPKAYHALTEARAAAEVAFAARG